MLRKQQRPRRYKSMKKFAEGARDKFPIVIHSLIVSLALLFGLSVTNAAGQNASNSQAKSKQLRTCPANPDPAYRRKDVLQKLADMLNESVPEYKRVDPKGFFVDNERSARFFVNDLTDISNRQKVNVGSCNDFIE